MSYITRFPGFKAKALTFSYDDGNVADRRLVRIFNDHALKATFNLNSGWTNDRDEWRVHKDEVLDLYAGHEIAVHGQFHLSATEFDSAVIANDVIEDRKFFEALTGSIVKGMAYPNGTFSDDAVTLLRLCGIKYSRTVISSGGFDLPTDWLRLRPTCHHNDERLNDLADSFIAFTAGDEAWNGRPRLFYVWGHSYEFDRDNSWDIIQNFADKICDKPDVWYATNVEIYDYLTAVDRLEWSVTGATVRNPSAVDVFLRINGRDLLVPANSTVSTK